MKALIFGITGKMGKAFEKLHRQKQFELLKGFSKSAPFDLQKDCLIAEKADLIIDFTLPESLKNHLMIAKRLHLPIVVGTTGLDEEKKKYLIEASRNIPIFYSANFSLGMALLKKIAREIYQSFPDAAIDLIDIHHAQKKDSPSGSALALLKTFPHARSHSIRAKNVVGEHLIYFHLENEKLEIKHSAFKRTLFAEGALRAARFLLQQQNGLYQMEDLLINR